MFIVREVKSVGHSKLYDCITITYEDESMDKFAACTEHLYPKCGDMVEIYSDDYVHYKGFGAMVLKVV